MSAKIMGLDIGDKRIGVAIADREAPFPAPFATLEAGKSLAQELHTIIKRQNITDVVVGMPRNQSGERTKQSDRVEKIISLLKLPSNINLYWQDESLTSVRAETELQKRKKPFEKKDIDALAATYILDDFVNSVMKAPLKTLPQKPLLQESSALRIDKKNRPKKFRKTLLLLVIPLLLTTLIAAPIWWYIHNTQPRTREDVYHVAIVKEGDTSSSIAKNLEDTKIIKNQQAFLLYLKLHGVQSLKAGSYRLSSKQSVDDIVKIIETGKVTKNNILIIPGLRLDQIIAELQTKGFEKKELEAALDNARNHPLLGGVATSVPLEGYLFPDTYSVSADTSAEAFIKAILDNFQSKITPDMKRGFESQGLTTAQAVILASIVQKEVSSAKDQKTVAQVFLKRFKEGHTLGADPTFKYAAALMGKKATPELDSPYNTRKYAGLPPSAISNFNLSALEAVAYPTSTDYNFFVAGDDGVTHFSHTQAEHDRLTKQYCTTLCQ